MSAAPVAEQLAVVARAAAPEPAERVSAQVPAVRAAPLAAEAGEAEASCFDRCFCQPKQEREPGKKSKQARML